MANKWQEIVDAAVLQIKNASTSAGARVYPGRDIPAALNEMPAVMVYPGDESAEQDSIPDIPQARTTELLIHTLATNASESGLQSALNTLGNQIEDAIKANDTLGGVVQWARYATRSRKTDDKGEAPMGGDLLTFIVTYRG
jgi:hypothetical protein